MTRLIDCVNRKTFQDVVSAAANHDDQQVTMENMCSYAYFCYFFECHFKPNFIRGDFVLAINF